MSISTKPILYCIRVLIIAFLFSACSTRYVYTAWKNQHAYPGNYNKIMVFAIVNSDDSLVRKELENHFKESFESLGYPAISSYSEFGTSLRSLGQEETFKNLCDRGIDAVVTIACITRQNREISKEAFAAPAAFFFDRIWSYKKDQELIPQFTGNSLVQYSWELILFDLPTLEPHYVAKTKIMEGTLEKGLNDKFWEPMIQRLRKDRFLKKRPPVRNTTLPKAF